MGSWDRTALPMRNDRLRISRQCIILYGLGPLRGLRLRNNRDNQYCSSTGYGILRFPRHCLRRRGGSIVREVLPLSCRPKALPIRVLRRLLLLRSGYRPSQGCLFLCVFWLSWYRSPLLFWLCYAIRFLLFQCSIKIVLWLFLGTLRGWSAL